MYLGKLSSLVAMLAVLAGCSTIRNAWEVQRSVSPKGEEGGAAEVRGDFAIGDYTLRELIDFAFTNRPSIVARNLAVKDARLALKAIRSDAPLVSTTPWSAFQLSASGNHSESSESFYWDDPQLKTSGGPSAGISLSVLLWDFGRNNARARAQSERVVAAEMELAEEGYKVIGEVSDAYFGFFEKTALLEVALTNQAEYAAHYEKTRAMLEAGEAMNLDVLRAKLDLATARERTVAASNTVMIYAVELARSLGLEAWRIPNSEYYRLAANALSKFVRVYKQSDFDVCEAVEYARTNAPVVRVARARLRAAKSDVDYAVADLLPELRANASLSWVDPLWMWNWSVGAAQTLFTGFSKVNAVDRAVVGLETAAAEVDAVELQRLTDIAVAVANRDNACEVIATVADSLAAAKENLDVVREQFGVGEASRVEYAAAVSDYVEELANSVIAFYEEQKCEVDLYELLGMEPIYE